MRVIIDTSILIDYLRGGTKWEEFISNSGNNAELFLPTVVIFELFSGKSAEDSSVKTKITNFIRYFKRIDLTEDIALQAGELYREVGKHISPQDYIIAASALRLNAQVLTLNKKHFDQIPNLVVY